MTKKIVFAAVIFVTIALSAFYSAAQAEEGKPLPLMGVRSGTQAPNVAGVVGKVDYTEFKPRGESAIVIKDKNGQAVKISLEELKNGATVLATYRKSEDKKNPEKNILVSLSIIKPAQPTKGTKK